MEKKEKIIKQIEVEQRTISYDIKEFTIELYVSKYLKNIEQDDNELYVPDYQREFVWDDKHQSRFIESLFLGLPLPFMFSAEIKETGRLEIVDGSQRIRTLSAFLNDELTLSHLEKLTEMNNCKYSDLPVNLQRNFRNNSIRMVVLSSKATEDVRNEMFDRINTSSVPLLPMETRRGIYKGKFTEFIAKLAKEDKFKKLCPMAKYMQNRREEEELILRLFAFSEIFPNFSSVERIVSSKAVFKYSGEKSAISGYNCTDTLSGSSTLISANLYPVPYNFSYKKILTDFWSQPTIPDNRLDSDNVVVPYVNGTSIL